VSSHSGNRRRSRRASYLAALSLSSAETYVPPTNTIGDLGDGFYQEQMAINGGRMDKDVATGGVGALPIGSYDAMPLPLGQLARRYTLDDEFFHAAYLHAQPFLADQRRHPGMARCARIHEGGAGTQRRTRQGRAGHP
jgi:hypothetical protein